MRRTRNNSPRFRNVALSVRATARVQGSKWRLLPLLLLLSASFAIAADSMDETRLIKKIELLGGKVERAEAVPGAPVVGISFAGSRRFGEKYIPLLKEFPRLTRLDLSGTMVGNEALRALGQFKHLERLDLSGTRVTADGFVLLREMAGLRALVLGTDNTKTLLDHGDWKDIGDLTTLVELDLSGVNATDRGVRELTRLSDLTRLSLSIQADISPAGLRELHGLSKLNDLTLDLSRVAAPDEIVDELIAVDAFPGLSTFTLKLSGEWLTAAGLERLSELRQRTDLELSFRSRKLTQVELKRFRRIECLTSLQLDNSPLDDDGLAMLVGLGKLRRLYLSRTKITGAGLRHLRGHTSLQCLGLSESKITDVGLAELRDLDGLTELDLGRTGITDAGLVELRKLTKLRKLDLRENQITDAGLREVAELPELSVLYLVHTQITDEGLKDIGRLEKLTALGLSGTRMTDRGISALAGLKHLKLLGLSGTRITDAALKEIADFASLTNLAIDGTKIGDAGLHALRGLDDLRTLFLDRTRITDAGLKELRDFKSLTDVYLSHCAGISDEAIVELREAAPNLNVTR